MEQHEPERPELPDRVAGLRELSYDLWWAWHDHAREVFRVLDYPLWRATAHNPVKLLQLVSAERLGEVAGDPAFLHLYDSALEQLHRARTARDTWWSRRTGLGHARPIAYCSAEFALHQSLPIYAGGLGVLAGDHCKEASDLGLPLIAIGFMYPQGYFHQRLSADGWQEEHYVRLDWQDAPIERATLAHDQDCVIAVPLGNRTVLAQVWHVRLGCVQLYLLDTDLEENAPWDRELSARLYGGDREMRIQQEIVLGIGGVRAVRALGYDPILWHLNEGHAAFVVLQRIRDLIEHGTRFDQALEEVRRTTAFTTHTPVAAGHDAFPFSMVETHLAGCWGSLGESREAFLALGGYDNGQGTQFNMTALAVRSSGAINGVSELHGEVTRKMWAPLFEELGRPDPVTSVTNGMHVPSWLSVDMARLFDQYLDARWREQHDDPTVWEDVLTIPDEELWHLRQRLRRHLFTFVRERMRDRWLNQHVSPARVLSGGTLLDAGALTIGFARRFATYKRAELVFHDPARLAHILNQLKRPVQIIFAGKAHPADDPGKRALQGVYHRAVDPAYGGRVAFVDDYDLHVAHFLVQGCDVWLNNPRKPLEASGTSGMKASLNGVLNVSIGDGWWPEGYTGTNGWLIDPGESHDDPAAQDAADAEALYRLLEDQIVPAFYERDDHDVPRRWIRMVKEAIRTIAPRFSTRRMLKEYVERTYLPAIEVVTGKG
ncbi:MAG: alpha-glucan family phosphorylase [Luteitalea sp.]|nr:alpha-glucan family phosphorylase [Luteitalea sp.]